MMHVQFLIDRKKLVDAGYAMRPCFLPHIEEQGTISESMELGGQAMLESFSTLGILL